MNIVRSLFLVALGIIGAAIALEAVLRVLPVSSGDQIVPQTQANPLLRGPADKPMTTSYGWNFRLAESAQLNNIGLPTESDFQKSPNGIGLIGDSFIRADQVESDQKLSSLLAAKQPRPVFAIGQNGASLVDHLVATDWLTEQFGVTDFVYVLVEGDLSQAVLKRPGMHQLIRANGMTKIELSPIGARGRLFELLRKSALARYLIINLKLQANFLKAAPPEAGPLGQAATQEKAEKTGGLPTSELKALSQFFVSQFAERFPDKNALFVLDAQRVYGEAAKRPRKQRKVEIFANDIEAAGFTVVRLKDAFDQFTQETGLAIDNHPTDMHWNEAGQQIVANEILETLRTF